MSHVDDATLHELLDDELDPVARQQVEAHLSTCGDCARRFAEATAMARQVVSLLTALDEGALPKLMVTPVARRDLRASVSAVAAPGRHRRLPALQRIAIAASVMLVAGVSYQVGKRGDQRAVGVVASRAASTESVVLSAPVPDAETAAAPPAAPVPAAPVPAAPVSAAPVPAAPTPSAPVPSAATSAPSRAAAADQREAQRAAESREVASAVRRADDAFERRATLQDARVGEQEAGAPPPPRARTLRMPDAAAGPVAAASAVLREANPSSTPERELAGYATVEERSAPAVPAITKRRYVSVSGTALVLTIVQGAAPAPSAAAATTATQYLVSSSNGRSAVRWQMQGMTYELQGALPADSLMKLATQLR